MVCWRCARAAWAHNFDDGRSIAASFEELPGTSFVVNGAANGHDAVLTTTSAEMTWRNSWSVGLTFVHSGRANARHLPGPQHPTMGCIRTTDDAMQAISALMRQQPLTAVEVTNNTAGGAAATARNRARPIRGCRAWLG